MWKLDFQLMRTVNHTSPPRLHLLAEGCGAGILRQHHSSEEEFRTQASPSGFCSFVGISGEQAVENLDPTGIRFVPY